VDLDNPDWTEIKGYIHTRDPPPEVIVPEEPVIVEPTFDEYFHGDPIPEAKAKPKPKAKPIATKPKAPAPASSAPKTDMCLIPDRKPAKTRAKSSKEPDFNEIML
jgi:hypothetical protein